MRGVLKTHAKNALGRPRSLDHRSRGQRPRKHIQRIDSAPKGQIQPTAGGKVGLLLQGESYLCIRTEGFALG